MYEVDLFTRIKHHAYSFYGGLWLWIGARTCILPWFGINVISNSTADLDWSLIVGLIVTINFWNDYYDYERAGKRYSRIAP